MFRKFVEIKIKDDDDFLKIAETLRRIGIKKGNSIIQQCHILHKTGKYYIVHYKELYRLDGIDVNVKYSDIKRRNTIANVLEEWGLCKIVNKELVQNNYPKLQGSRLTIVKYKDAQKYNLIPMYEIGKRKVYDKHD